MRRIPEPELMDSLEQTQAYAQADFSEPNALFCQNVQATLTSPVGHLLDLGCGSGGLLVELAEALPQWSMLGVDAGPNMLKLASQWVNKKTLGSRISLLKAHLPTDCQQIKAAGPFDAIVSNSLLHHLNNPMTLWHSIAFIGRPGMQVVVMDLIRPQSRQDAQALVEAHTRGAADVLKADFYNSLLAAWRVDEVEAHLAQMGWAHWTVQPISNRHWLAVGTLP